jgi:hypothetical protein
MIKIEVEEVASRESFLFFLHSAETSYESLIAKILTLSLLFSGGA